MLVVVVVAVAVVVVVGASVVVELVVVVVVVGASVVVVVETNVVAVVVVVVGGSSVVGDDSCVAVSIVVVVVGDVSASVVAASVLLVVGAVEELLCVVAASLDCVVADSVKFATVPCTGIAELVTGSTAVVASLEAVGACVVVVVVVDVGASVDCTSDAVTEGRAPVTSSVVACTREATIVLPERVRVAAPETVPSPPCAVSVVGEITSTIVDTEPGDASSDPEADTVTPTAVIVARPSYFAEPCSLAEPSTAVSRTRNWDTVGAAVTAQRPTLIGKHVAKRKKRS